MFDLATTLVPAERLAEYIEAGVAAQAGELAPGIGRIRAARIVERKVAIENDRPGQQFSRQQRKLDVHIAVEVEAVARVAA
ncbi:hypothetical protein G3I24_48515 [Micromonospora aurantiaca]|nr:hypothetical protein [Micromonospora aurantiaca]